MNRLDREIRDLFDRTAQIREEFLEAELLTCFTALDMARFELSVGEIHITEREIESISKGVVTIERFLPDIPADRQSNIETKLAKLKTELEALKADMR